MSDRRRKNNSATSPLGYQVLEPRQLLASVTLIDGLLEIGGTASDDVVSLGQFSINGPLQLTENGRDIGQFAPQDVNRISFYGLDGDDSFTVSGNVKTTGSGFSQGNALDSLSINFYGGDGDDDFIAQFEDFSSIELLAIGGDGNDRLLANSLDGLASSGSGNSLTKLRFYGANGRDDLQSKGIATGNTRLIGGEGADTILGGLADDVLRGGNGEDSVRGGGGDDILIGGEGNDSLDGEDGDDSLLDNLGNDVLIGGAGDDWIFGGAGEDVINGSAGNDRLLGGDDTDSIFGDEGNDSLFGGRGNDTISGGSGEDHLSGFDGDDFLYGGNGNDKLFGGTGLDNLFGEAGDDILGGGLGADYLIGGVGDDLLFGNENDDELDGGIGADYLNGGTENDRLFGGSDTVKDTLIGREGHDTFFQQTNNDRLVDFNDSEDEQTTHLNDFETFRVAFYNLLFTSRDVTAQNAHLDRVQADILGLSEITGTDKTQIDNYAAANGYQPPLYAENANGHSLTQALLTKFPVLFSETVSSGADANEFIRPPIYAELDINGKRTGVYVIHSQTICQTGPCDTSVPIPALEFARAIEAIRIAEHQASRLALFQTMETILIGDHNEDPATPQTASFDSKPAGLAPWYSLGAGITFPVNYTEHVQSLHSSLGLQTLNSTDLDGNDSTLFANAPNTAITSENKIDFIATSAGFEIDGHEILNSEATQSGGLPKYGDDLPFDSSRSASDHKLIFADVKYKNV